MKTCNVSMLCRENLVKSTHQDSIRLISLWDKILPSLISLYLKFAILGYANWWNIVLSVTCIAVGG